MQIIEKDFKLIPVDESSPFFDLELLYVVKPRNGEPRQEFKNAGFGMSLYSALQRIVSYRLNCKHKEEAIKLKEYFKEYKEELTKLKQLLEV